MNGATPLADVVAARNAWKARGEKVSFTNGCFDILHAGHVDYLAKAKAYGDRLILGLNSDASVRRIKGEKRPVVPQGERSYILANLESVDLVVLFDEDDPLALIKALTPDILVKGADWALENIIGRDVVEDAGGRVERVPFVARTSTTDIIKTILDRYAT
ncbi:MAG: D-glycero-beta-D-manno-heptose 1-phosphate adenylyltransferase [Ignavibacteriales bacterium]|jgi:rfaE bifunctional protein nucleotidyltransferase chain/domain|nr:D-glycero-beta-D-manno-heptose 1-phosphate adenylyltransferase [Ignavibacteriales bacterium]